eukprot:9206077-Alexandrium_andersonii.AAC.1
MDWRAADCRLRTRDSATSKPPQPLLSSADPDSQAVPDHQWQTTKTPLASHGATPDSLGRLADQSAVNQFTGPL